MGALGGLHQQATLIQLHQMALELLTEIPANVMWPMKEGTTQTAPCQIGSILSAGHSTSAFARYVVSGTAL